MAQPSNEWKMEELFPLGSAEMKELERMGTAKTFSKGDAIWESGASPDSVWLVKEGRVNMEIMSSDGNASLVQFCTRAQTFCPAAAISGKAYPCTSIAATDVQAVAVPRAAFLAFFDRLPGLAKSFLKQMAPVMCDSHCQQAQSARPVEVRLASLLGGLNRRFNGDKLPFTRQELANMTGTTVESAIRTLSKWEKEGVIQSSRGSIEVMRPEVLEEALT